MQAPVFGTMDTAVVTLQPDVMGHSSPTCAVDGAGSAVASMDELVKAVRECKVEGIIAPAESAPRKKKKAVTPPGLVAEPKVEEAFLEQYLKAYPLLTTCLLTPCDQIANMEVILDSQRSLIGRRSRDSDGGQPRSTTRSINFAKGMHLTLSRCAKRSASRAIVCSHPRKREGSPQKF